MSKVIRSLKCLEDLDGIFDYVAESSPQNAEMLIRQFQERFEVLAKHPQMGRLRPELSEKLRSWNVHRFVIFISQSPMVLRWPESCIQPWTSARNTFESFPNHNNPLTGVPGPGNALGLARTMESALKGRTNS